MNTKYLNKIKKISSSPPENWGKFVSWWKNDQSITFYSWECPPRKVEKSKTGMQFVNFDVDIKGVVRGKRIDEFTEIPRINTRQKDEKWFVKNVVIKNPKANYVKLIADTNGIYLYPNSLSILGKKKIERLSRIFKTELKNYSSQNINKEFPKFKLFTEIQAKYKKEYKNYFNLIMNSFTGNLNSKFISKKLLDYWKARIIKHVGLSIKMKKERQDLLKRVISSYAAEGMIFNLAGKSGSFPNPVWINWEEKPMSGRTTEILRSYFGLDPIPKIYLL